MDPLSLVRSAVAAFPSNLKARSGKIFYTGREAFAEPSNIYLLGLNPGGDPDEQSDETIATSIRDFDERDTPWSAYAYERWAGKDPGKHGMAPRVLHLFDRLGLDPLRTPASNVVFLRTRSQADLAKHMQEWMPACWPVHQTVIDALGVRTIVCFGGKAGEWVRHKLGALEPVGSACETNQRRWKYAAHRNVNLQTVVTLTHPSRADWCNADADPSNFVKCFLQTAAAIYNGR